MRRRGSFFLFLLIFCGTLGSHADTIKVQTVWQNSSLVVDLSQGVYAEVVPPDGGTSRVAHFGVGPLRFKLLPDGRFVVTRGSARLSATSLKLQGSGMSVDGVEWPERVEIQVYGGELTAIFELPLEDYVSKVLPNEMPLSWPEESLKAQAIAIRTYALFQRQSRRDQDFHVYSTVKDQVFKWGDIPSQWRDKVRRVMAATAGEVLLDERGQLASIHYHADCGGAAEQSPWVWNGGANKGVTQCSEHGSPPWSFRISKEEASKILSREHRIPGRQVVGWSYGQRSDSGRWKDLKVRYDGGEIRSIQPERLRNLLGYHRLRSTRFSVIHHKGEFEFRGVGYGHGVGLCQQGSRAWASRGARGRQILQAYYPHLSVGKIWQGDDFWSSPWTQAQKSSSP